MSFLKSIFQAYNESDYGKKRKKEKLFRDLEHFPMLHSSKYLNILIDEAETEEQHDLILDHLYKFDTLDVDSYKKVEQKIVDKRWKV